MKKITIASILTGLFIFCAFQAQADPITPSSVWGALDPTGFDTLGGGNDWGDAVGYTNAGNRKGSWQGLGVSNGIDNGLQWSVGGSDYGTTADLVIGQEVTFKFLFWQANNGNHTYDQIFAAFDSGQDGVFDDLDTILYEQIWTNMDIRDDVRRDNSKYLEFELSFIIPDTMTIGSTWLRARATCWHTPYPDVDAYGWLGQGETEDYEFNIVAEPVPEPATMLLFGSGLLGLAGIKRRKK